MLLKPVLVVIVQPAAQPVDDHENYGGRQDAPDDNQQKFHSVNLAALSTLAIPATVGRPLSAEMATNGSNLSGISAYVPFLQGAAMVPTSEKEGAPWMNTAESNPTFQAVTGSVSFWQPFSSFWSCFTRCSRVVVRPSIRRQSTQPAKVRRHLKIWSHLNRPHLRQANKAKTTYMTTAKGGRSDTFALGAFITAVRTGSVRLLYALHTPHTKGVPC